MNQEKLDELQTSIEKIINGYIAKQENPFDVLNYAMRVMATLLVGYINQTENPVVDKKTFIFQNYYDLLLHSIEGVDTEKPIH